MTTGGNVLQMLCPTIEWTIAGNDYDSITWHSGTPAITRQEFENGFLQYDTWKAEKDAEKVQAKAAAQAKLQALGLTVEDLTALGLGGN